MSAYEPMSAAEWELIAGMLRNSKPARTPLLVSLAEGVRDCREHDHASQREDWYCLNLVAYAGERMAPVLRRLLDAEAEVERLRADRHAANDQMAAVIHPYGCARCGLPLPHGVQCGGDGCHSWERPTDAQILARMRERRAAHTTTRGTR